MTTPSLDDLQFHGDTQDFEEVLANLTDNASKWARTKVLISGSKDGEWITVLVEDDGKGVAQEKFEEILSRGLRLDEAVQGSGLGLPIAVDIVESYGGTLVLEQASLGGLSVKVTLPAI